jgi:hypothetical protein
MTFYEPHLLLIFLCEIQMNSFSQVEMAPSEIIYLWLSHQNQLHCQIHVFFGLVTSGLQPLITFTLRIFVTGTKCAVTKAEYKLWICSMYNFMQLNNEHKWTEGYNVHCFCMMLNLMFKTYLKFVILKNDFSLMQLFIYLCIFSEILSYLKLE